MRATAAADHSAFGIAISGQRQMAASGQIPTAADTSAERRKKWSKYHRRYAPAWIEESCNGSTEREAAGLVIRQHLRRRVVARERPSHTVWLGSAFLADSMLAVGGVGCVPGGAECFVLDVGMVVLAGEPVGEGARVESSWCRFEHWEFGVVAGDSWVEQHGGGGDSCGDGDASEDANIVAS